MRIGSATLGSLGSLRSVGRHSTGECPTVQTATAGGGQRGFVALSLRERDAHPSRGARGLHSPTRIGRHIRLDLQAVNELVELVVQADYRQKLAVLFGIQAQLLQGGRVRVDAVT